MRSVDNTTIKTSLNGTVEALSSSSEALTKLTTYHELAENPIVEVDVIEQLQQNLQKLTDLHGRLNFMMREVRGLMKL